MHLTIKAILITIVMTATVLCACGTVPGMSPLPSAGGTPSAGPEAPVSPPYVFDEETVQYIRTNGYTETVSYPYLVTVSDRASLDAYHSDYADTYFLGHVDRVYADTTIGFADAIALYDDAFFAEHDLLMAILEEGSGSIRHQVTDIKDGIVEIEHLVPEVGTCDMAEWHLLIPIPKGMTPTGIRFAGSDKVVGEVITAEEACARSSAAVLRAFSDYMHQRDAVSSSDELARELLYAQSGFYRNESYYIEEHGLIFPDYIKVDGVVPPDTVIWTLRYATDEEGIEVWYHVLSDGTPLAEGIVYDNRPQ